MASAKKVQVYYTGIACILICSRGWKPMSELGPERYKGLETAEVSLIEAPECGK